MPNDTPPSVPQPQTAQPDYAALVRYLMQPLLEHPNSLSIHCESSRGGQRVLVRVALGDNEQGRVLGRGGRNLDAMQVVLGAAAQAMQQTVRLEVFDLRRPDGEGRRRAPSDRPRGQRSRPTKPPVPRKR